MNIYVSNLGFHVEDTDLKLLFSAFGEVTSANVMKDAHTGRSLRYGFVEMPNDMAANEAIGKLSGKVIEGRALSISIARGKHHAKPMPANSRTSSWK